MGIYVKFTMTTHQICKYGHVTRPWLQIRKFSFFAPSAILNFRKSYQIWVNWLKNTQLQAKNKLGVDNTPPSAYRVSESYKGNLRAGRIPPPPPWNTVNFLPYKEMVDFGDFCRFTCRNLDMVPFFRRVLGKYLITSYVMSVFFYLLL